ncbi:family 3 putative glycoside hydrolase [Podospora australis]|uniref:xylan 1,4-beta-xylosidase n=1 Tax=Podospora australis TaxID=1536484 RepID=A0AAN6X5F3_9PEZI|nr:family 3 putative glycoside hydrolase [Podospora australis]
MKSIYSPALLAGVLAFGRAYGFEYPDCTNSQNAVCNAGVGAASAPGRAAALVSAMTIEEKLVNLVDMMPGSTKLSTGNGTSLLPPYALWSEALHGLAASPGVKFNSAGSPYSYATSFANIITLASAFDDELVYEVGDTISTEARAFINAGQAGLNYWTPNVNPYKDPRWGRGHEVRIVSETTPEGRTTDTPGEDPVRIKGYVKSLLAGLEGKESIRKVVATCKHLAAYDLERWQGMVRYRFDAIVSSQDLSEYYLPPFQQCARDSKVGSFMCSYNSLNGTPACGDTYLLDDILRKHWNWTEHSNFVTSDCNAIQHFLPEFHNYSATPAHAAAAAFNAGTDTVCEVPGYPPFTNVTGAYQEGLLSEAVVDRALRRIYEGLIRAGYFDTSPSNPPDINPFRSISWSDINSPKAQALALQSATDGIVLLKNDGLLPLNLTGKTVALVGHWANASWQMLGGYSGPPPYFHNPVYAAWARNLTFTYAPGPVNETLSSQDMFTGPALAAANKSDIILYFGGTDLTIAAEDRDRDSIAWPPAQLALVNSLAQLGKPLIVTQLGDQLDDSPLLQNPNVSAVLWAGYPGQSGGTAVFDILTGTSSPAGRLPVTQYPANYTTQIPLTEMALRPSAKHPGRTYRWYTDSVLPFGYGLHYTTFKATFGVFSTTTYNISDLLAACPAGIQHRDLCPFPQISVWVSNTGNRTSDYVALVSTKGEYGPKPYPLKTLVGYKRLRGIEAGDTAAALVDVKLGDLARVDLSGNTVLYPGKYKFLLDVTDPVMSEVEIELVGEEVVLDYFPQPPESRWRPGK